MNKRKNVCDFLEPEYKDNCFYRILAPTGCGKTEWFQKLIDSYIEKYPSGRIVIITYRIVLGMKLYQELEKREFSYYINSTDNKRVIISCESLNRWTYSIHNSPLLIIMDEINGIVSHFSSSTMQNCFNDFTNVFDEILNQANSLVVLDAYYDLSTQDFVDSIKNKFSDLINFEFPMGVNPTKLIDCFITQNETQFFNKIEDDLRNQINIFLWSGSKAYLERLLGLIVSRKLVNPQQVLMITAESPPLSKKKSGANPNEFWVDYKIVACTPCLITGVSYTRTARSVYIINNPKILPKREDLMQAAGRIRNQINLTFYLPKKKKDFPSTFESVKNDLAMNRIKRFNHLRNQLSMSSIIENCGDGILRFVVRFNNTKFTRAIILSLMERFRFNNDSTTILKDLIMKDERYQTPLINEIPCSLSYLFTTKYFSEHQGNQPIDDVLHRSLSELSQLSASVFELSDEIENQIPDNPLDASLLVNKDVSIRPEDFVWFRTLRILHAYRLIGSDYYDYDGKFDNFKWIFPRAKQLISICSIIVRLIHIISFKRLRKFITNSPEEILMDEITKVVAANEAPITYDFSLNDLREVQTATKCDLETGWMPSTLDWNRDELDKIARRVSSETSSCPVCKAADDYRRRPNIVCLANFVREAFKSIGIRSVIGKRSKSKKNGDVYQTKNFYYKWENLFVLYLAKRKFVEGEIASSYFVFPLLEGWMRQTNFFCGFRDAFKYVREPEFISAKLNEYFVFDNRPFLTWKMDDYSKILHAEEILAEKIKSFKEEVGIFIAGDVSFYRDYSEFTCSGYEITKNNENEFEFKERYGLKVYNIKKHKYNEDGEKLEEILFLNNLLNPGDIINEVEEI